MAVILLDCTALNVLDFIVFYCTRLTALYRLYYTDCNVLCTVLFFSVLYCTVLYCTVLYNIKFSPWLHLNSFKLDLTLGYTNSGFH